MKPLDFPIPLTSIKIGVYCRETSARRAGGVSSLCQHSTTIAFGDLRSELGCTLNLTMRGGPCYVVKLKANKLENKTSTNSSSSMTQVPSSPRLSSVCDKLLRKQSYASQSSVIRREKRFINVISKSLGEIVVE